MSLHCASITVELREVFLANKPEAMLALSSKGTVPVLQLSDQVLDESLDVMHWALGTGSIGPGKLAATRTARSNCGIDCD